MTDARPALPARRPAAARALDPLGRDYGVWIIVGSLLVVFVGVGVGYYGLAVLVPTLREEHDWSRTLVGLATGTYFTVSGLTSWLVGPYIDRRGPLGVMTAGIVVLGVSIMWIGAVSAPWHLFVLYSVMAVGFGCAASVGVNSILARWFVTRRAEAMSIAFNGVSLGGVVLAPLATWLIARNGLAAAGVGLGLLVLAVGLPVVQGVLVWDPRQMGREPDFGRPLELDNVSLDVAVQHRSWTRRQAMRTVQFWLLLVSFVIVLTAQTGYLIQQVGFLEERFDSRQLASFALSVTGVGSIVARLVVGRFADTVDKRWFTVGLFGLQASSVLLIAYVENTAATWLFVLLIGFTVGNVYMMQTLLITEVFGLVSLGTVMGAIALATQTASGFGPFAVGWLSDTTDGFRVPFTVTAVATIVAAMLVSRVRPIEPPSQSPTLAGAGNERSAGEPPSR